MKAVVIGGGVIGMLSAYYLRRAGYSVTVLEKNTAVGQEASAANANFLCFESYIFSMISPGLLKDLPNIVMGKIPSIRIESWFDLAFLRWGMHVLPNMLSGRKYRDIGESLYAINQESKALMQAFVQEHAVDFSFRQCGKLHLYPDAKSLEESFAAFEGRGLAGHVRVLNGNQLLTQEPGIAHASRSFAGGLYLESEYVGNCEAFTLALREIVLQEGVAVIEGCDVSAFQTEGEKVVAAQTVQGCIDADAFVMAAGWNSAPLLKTLGIYCPIYPVKGYTYELFPDVLPFQTSLLDTASKIVVAPLKGEAGESLKVSSGVFFGRAGGKQHERFLQHLRENTRALYPEADFSNARLYSGYRPWTPDSLPRVEKTRYNNLYLNTGHGMAGWTMAHASGKRLADMMAEDNAA